MYAKGTISRYLPKVHPFSYSPRGGDRSEVGGRIGLGRSRTDEVEVKKGR